MKALISCFFESHNDCLIDSPPYKLEIDSNNILNIAYVSDEIFQSHLFPFHLYIN
jgi:hypothetical protein